MNYAQENFDLLMHELCGHALPAVVLGYEAVIVDAGDDGFYTKPTYTDDTSQDDVVAITACGSLYTTNVDWSDDQAFISNFDPEYVEALVAKIEPHVQAMVSEITPEQIVGLLTILQRNGRIVLKPGKDMVAH